MTEPGTVGRHQLRAAALVLTVLGGRPCSIELARRSYRSVSTHGEHSSLELQRGEDLLVTLGLVTRTARMLRPRVVDLDDLDENFVEAVMGELLNEGAAAPITHDRSGAFRARIGSAGEEAVVRACHEELVALNATSLVMKVERVSLVSDAFGYDVRAPRLDGSERLMEVKTQLGEGRGTVRFFLTRNEYDVGRDEPDWSLVMCITTSPSLDDVRVHGWCPVDALEPYLPLDNYGRWTEACVTLPRSVLRPGLPSASHRSGT
ncbi:MAG: DUF3883 domain-containing protein [Sandaracinus sp.]|nr:DUF3883 domain-containing protein [Sandaracinus sp.]